MVVNGTQHFVKLFVVYFSCIALSPYTLKILWFFGVRESTMAFLGISKVLCTLGLCYKAKCDISGP